MARGGDAVTERDTSLHAFWDRPLRDLLELLQATPAGLTSDEATRRVRLYGPNSFVREARFAGLIGFLRFLVTMRQHDRLKDEPPGLSPLRGRCHTLTPLLRVGPPS